MQNTMVNVASIHGFQSTDFPHTIQIYDPWRSVARDIAERISI